MWMRKFVWKITRVTNKTSQICQYRICPPVASMQATQRRRILLMSLAICSWGILLHSSCKAAPKAWSVLGRGTLCRTRWPRMSQTSQGIEQANRDDPHCSAAGTAVLSSPDEVLCCHPAALRGFVKLKAEQQHFIDVALARQSSVKHKQLCTGTNRYAAPYHKTSSSIPIMFNNGAVRVPLTSATPNATSSVKHIQQKPWLVGKEYSRPLLVSPLTMLPCPC